MPAKQREVDDLEKLEDLTLDTFEIGKEKPCILSTMPVEEKQEVIGYYARIIAKEVSHKDHAARMWCENATALAGVEWRYLKIMQKVFEDLRPEDFGDLMVLAAAEN